MKKIYACFMILAVLVLFGCAPTPSSSSQPEQVKIALGMGSMNHPVHRIVQVGFTKGVKKADVQGSIAGLDNGSTMELQEKFESAITQDGVKGMVLWASDDTYYQFMRDMKREYDTVFVVPHFAHEYVDTKDFIAANLYTSMQDIGTAVADELAVALVEAEITQGSIGVTQAGTTIEGAAYDAFQKRMNELAPQFTVLPVVFEGMELSEATKKVSSLIENTPDIVGGFGCSGNSALSWSAAKEALGREDIIVIGVDYTESSLDLVKSGKVQALVSSNTYEEGFDGAVLLADLLGGKSVNGKEDWEHVYDPIVITKDRNLEKYQSIVEEVISAYN